MPVGITTDGRWLLAGEARKMLEGGALELPDAFEVEGDLVALPSASRASDVDVVIPLLHGPYGEDGTVQGVLELAGLPYVGAGVLASAVGMDKIAMKALFTSAGLANAPRSRCAPGTRSTRSWSVSLPRSAFLVS